MSNTLQLKKTWFKVVGHRPFDNNCMSTNLVNATSPEEAKKSMIGFYGFRNDDDNDKRKPNVIVDEVTPLMKG